MRIIHSADWHIGQTLNGWNRDAEHSAFLARLPELVRNHEVDALVVAGDIFDGVNPSSDATKMLYDALAALQASHRGLQTILIAGNHDAAGRLEAPRALFEAIGVRVVGMVHREGLAGPLDLSRHLMPVSDSSGEIRSYVLAIPYLRAGDLPAIQQKEEDDVVSSIIAGTRRFYADAVAAARKQIGDLPLIVTGHLHCAGATETEGSERRIYVGGEHAVPDDIFPSDVAYVALGHLHKAQPVGRQTVRYSGSPFPMSATEIDYEHGVTLVDLASSGTRCEHIQLPRTVPFIRLPNAGSLSVAELPTAITALGIDASKGKDTRPFVNVVVRPDGPSAGLLGEILSLMEEYPVRCAGVKIDRPAKMRGEAEPEPRKALSECDPTDLFEKAFLDLHGQEPGEQHRTAFETIRTGE